MNQQPPMPATMRMLFAAIDALVEEAVKEQVSAMQNAHISWHGEQKSKPSVECHTCLLVGLARKEEVGAVSAEVPEATR